MKQLMISLDKNILNRASRAAERMIEYGKKDELFIIVPSKEKKELTLSDTVHVWSTGGCKVRQFCKLKMLGKKLITEQGIAEITTQDPFFTGLVGVCLKKKTGSKLEVQVHGDFFGGNYYSYFRRWFGRYVVHQADRVRAVSERVRKSIENFVSKEKIEVRPIVVDFDSINKTNINLHQNYPQYKKIFLVLGRFDPVKNISWLIDIFPNVVKNQPNALLLIVGDGQEMSNLKSSILNLKLENNIKIESWTNDPWGYIKTVDCLLFPSLSESYGLVAMEANAAGTPVIMNDVGVANYELKPSDKVKILPINDKEKWIEAILNI